MGTKGPSGGFRFPFPRLVFPAAAAVFISCAGGREGRAPPPSPLPPLSAPVPSPSPSPALDLLDYQNREAGPPEPWLRAYLEGGAGACESLEEYRGAYLFVARIISGDLEVVTQWLEHFSPEEDFSRLVAERIRLRMERDPAVSAAEKYGACYEQTLRAAYRFSFRGGRRGGAAWARVRVSPGQEGFSSAPHYRGLVLMIIPRDTLEVQISGLLAGVDQSRRGRETREQKAAFEHLKERFFEDF